MINFHSSHFHSQAQNQEDVHSDAYYLETVQAETAPLLAFHSGNYRIKEDLGISSFGYSR